MMETRARTCNARPGRVPQRSAALDEMKDDLSLAGSLLARFGWVKAGHASARDHRIPLKLPEKVQEIRKSTQELAKTA